MINSSFFIENSEVIGLWIIFSFIGLVIFNMISEIVDRILLKRKEQKIKEAKIRQAIYRDAMLWRKQQREIEIKEYRKNFKKFYLNNVVNF